MGPVLNEKQKALLAELEKEMREKPELWITFDGINSRLTPEAQKTFFVRYQEILDRKEDE